MARAAREHERVEVASKLGDGHVDADVGAGDERHPLFLHELEAPVEEALLHLELGDPVAQEPTDPVATLEDGHGVTGPVTLLGGGEPRGPGADDGHLLAGAKGRRARGDPALVEGPLDDRKLDRLDRDRVVVDLEHARALARMMLPSGQPWWQNGMPQSMHRAACFFSSSRGNGR